MIYEKVVKILKNFKYVKGHNFIIYKTFSLVGDKSGGIGYGVSKSRDQYFSLNKSLINAKKNFNRISFDNLTTIPYGISSKYCKSIVLLLPSKKGGIISNNYLKVLFNLLGIININCKISGSNNLNNIFISCINALMKIKFF